jgi:hypothetical protein
MPGSDRSSVCRYGRVVLELSIRSKCTSVAGRPMILRRRRVRASAPALRQHVAHTAFGLHGMAGAGAVQA